MTGNTALSHAVDECRVQRTRRRQLLFRVRPIPPAASRPAVMDARVPDRGDTRRSSTLSGVEAGSGSFHYPGNDPASPLFSGSLGGDTFSPKHADIRTGKPGESRFISTFRELRRLSTFRD